MPPLVRIIVYRIVQVIPVLFGVTLLTFLMLNALPGDTAIAILGSNASKSAIRSLNIQLGLNKPLVTRYADWLGATLKGNLGHSFVTSQSVNGVLSSRVSVTLELVVLTAIGSFLLAVIFAAFSVLRSGGIIDKARTVLATTGLSIPNFVVALILVLVISVKFNLLPASGFVPISQGIVPNIQSMLLPTISIGLASFATLTNVLTEDMKTHLETEEYVLQCRAKGCSELRIVLNHLLRNGVVGTITLFGTNIGTLLGADVVVETVFNMPGLGQLLVNSIFSKDVPVVEGTVLVLAVVVVLANLIVDILHYIIDPRLRVGNSHV